MDARKLIMVVVMVVVAVLLLPFVLGDINVQCSPTIVSTDGEVTCNLVLSSPVQSISTIQFQVQQQNKLFTVQSVTGPTGYTVTFDPNVPNIGIWTASLGQSPTSLATITLAGAGVEGSTAIQVVPVNNQPILLDDQFNAVNYGVVNPSSLLVVQSAPQPVCGNALVEISATGPDEECDDGNVANGDGCSSSCLLEAGYTCSGQPSVCQIAPSMPVCGNGLIEVVAAGPDEECDDGNAMNNDGCSSACIVDPGFACAGQPSICTTSQPLICDAATAIGGSAATIPLDCFLENVREILSDNVEYPTKLQKISAVARELARIL